MILINEHCTGAAEMVAQFAKENHLATLVGMKTAGRLNAHCTFKCTRQSKPSVKGGTRVLKLGDEPKADRRSTAS